MQQSPSPQLSVIVPSYNKPEYLPECLKSIQAQTFTDWECIVVSDGSPRVEEIRRAVTDMRDSRFRLLELPLNGGTSVARNRGAEEARGPVLVWIDEDDMVLPQFIEELFNALRRSDADIVCSGIAFFGGLEKIYRTYIPHLEEILHNQPLGGAGFLVRKETWEQIGKWDEHPSLRKGREDNEWWIRVLANNLRVHLCEKILYLYRMDKEGPLVHLSRHHSCMSNQVSITNYVIKKHEALYKRYPASKKQYLYKAYKNEAAHYRRAGLLRRSAMRHLIGAVLYASPTEALRVLRSVLPCVLGETIVRLLVRIKRAASILE